MMHKHHSYNKPSQTPVVMQSLTLIISCWACSCQFEILWYLNSFFSVRWSCYSQGYIMGCVLWKPFVAVTASQFSCTCCSGTSSFTQIGRTENSVNSVSLFDWWAEPRIRKWKPRGKQDRQITHAGLFKMSEQTNLLAMRKTKHRPRWLNQSSEPNNGFDNDLHVAMYRFEWRVYFTIRPTEWVIKESGWWILAKWKQSHLDCGKIFKYCFISLALNQAVPVIKMLQKACNTHS